MKIICVDNFNREGPGHDDRVIAKINLSSKTENKKFGKVMVDALNKEFGGYDLPNFFKLVEDDYKLQEFIP